MSANHEKVQLPNNQIGKSKISDRQIVFGTIGFILLIVIICGLFFRKRPVKGNNENILQDEKSLLEKSVQGAGENNISENNELYDPKLLLNYLHKSVLVSFDFCGNTIKCSSKERTKRQVESISKAQKTKYEIALSYTEKDQYLCFYTKENEDIYVLVCIALCDFLPKKINGADIFDGKNLFWEDKKYEFCREADEKFFHITNFKILETL